MFGNSDDAYEKLQTEADTTLLNEDVASDFNRPILNRLRDFVKVAITSMKLYPNAFHLYHVEPNRIEIKVSGLSTAVLVFAPVEQLSAEVYLYRTAATKNLAMQRVLKHDLTFAELPVAYAVFSFVAGVSLHTVTDETMLRVAARQVGRVIRSLHLNPAQGFGAPNPNATWSKRTWASILQQWLKDRGEAQLLDDLLGKSLVRKFYAQTITHDSLQAFEPSVLYGDISPKGVLVMVHGNIQLEGLTRAGRIVAGDAMFDVAASMRASLGVPFRQGFFEGYTMHAPLLPIEVARIKRYSLLWRTIDVVSQLASERDKMSFAQSVTHVVAELEALD